MSYKEIADIMGVTERSVAGYRTSLFEKLDVNSREGLNDLRDTDGVIHVD